MNNSVSVHNRKQLDPEGARTIGTRISPLRIAIVVGLLLSMMIQITFAQFPAGLVSLWPADGDADDAVGSNHGFLVNGTTFGPGLTGKAFHFDGNDDMVVVPDHSTLRPITLTVSAWVNFDDLNSRGYGGAVLQPGLQYMVFKRNSRITQFSGYNILKAREPGRDFFVFALEGADGVGVTTHSLTSIETGRWYHVVGTYDTQQIKQFVNGKLESRSFHNVVINHGTQPLVFGRSAEDGEPGEGIFDAALNGSLDNVEVYDRALSDSEVQEIFRSVMVEAIGGLITEVTHLNLHNGIANSLDSKLGAALGALDDVNTNNNQAACNTLQAFINAVEAQRGKQLTNEQADALVERAIVITGPICPQ